MEERVRQEIVGLKEGREILQDLFRIAPPSEKGGTLRSIKTFEKKIADLEAKLRRTCQA